MSRRGDLAYLRSIGGYIALSVLIFFATAVMGYFAAEADPAIADIFMEKFEALRWILDLHPALMVLAIFLNNLIASSVAALLGLGLGFVPLLVVTTNGFLLGAVSYLIIHEHGLLFLLLGILPHGILELPAVLVSVGMGFRLGHLFALSVAGEKVDLRGETRAVLGVLARIIAPILLLAAAIETLITPLAISVII